MRETMSMKVWYFLEFLYTRGKIICTMTKKIITGVKPTGSSMHLGNLMGAVLPFRKHAESTDAAIFIADLHALTSVKD
jgi:tryptophanyl-tRNA synthetase